MANKVITEPYLKQALTNVKTYIDNKSASSGSSVTVDTELSATSVNAIANKAVKAALDNKADKTAIPSKVSQLSNDSGYLTKHQDISSLATKTEVDDKLTERLGDIKIKTYQLTDEQRSITVSDLGDYAPQGDLEDNTIYILDDTDNGINYNSYFVKDGIAYPLTSEVRDNLDLEGEAGNPFPMSVRGVHDYINSITDDKLSDNSTHLVQSKAIKKYIDSKATGGTGGSGGSITVDAELSADSTNPVQNKVITEELDNLRASMPSSVTVDTAMSATSLNPVQNKVVKAYIDSKALNGGSSVTVDSELSDTSENPIANKAVKIALDAKADDTITLAAEPPQNGYESGQINPKYVINCDNFTEVVTPADSKFSKYIYTLYKSEKSMGAMSFIVIKNPALAYLDLKNSTVKVRYVNGKEPVTTSEGYVWVGDIADKTAEAANIILVYNSDGEAMMFTDTYAGVINDSLRLTTLDIPTWYGVLKQTTGLEGKIINTEQDGFYIVDSNGNIGAVLSADKDNITGGSGSSSSLEYAEAGTVESINTILI